MFARMYMTIWCEPAAYVYVNRRPTIQHVFYDRFVKENVRDSSMCVQERKNIVWIKNNDQFELKEND